MSCYIHIGLGKSGSKFLQKSFFREISKLLNLELYVGNEGQKFNKKDNIIISNEVLVGEFYSNKNWEEKSFENKKNFGENSKIIIIIRRPIDYYSSLYCQLIHASIIKSENEFFKTENEIKKNFIEDNYYTRYEKFDYENLVKLYSQKFENVFVIKYEDLKNLKIWSKVFDDKKIINLKFADVYFNRSYSYYAIKLTFFVEKLLNLFGTNLFKMENIVSKFRQIKFLPSIITNRLAYELSWRFFIQHRFDKIFPYKSYKIQNKRIKNYLEIKHNEFYNNYKSSFYKNGKQFIL